MMPLVPTPHHVLGVDIGTGGVRALLVDTRTGTVRAEATNSCSLDSPHPLWSEQDPEEWWTAASNSINEVLATLGDPAEVAAVGFTGQMHGLVLLDEQGQVTRPAILWNDQRTSEQCDRINDLVGREEMVRITGGPALASFTAPKILWVMEHEPEVAAASRHLLLPKDYVRWRATGVHAIDASDASGTSLLDIETRQWSPELVKQLGIPEGWLPPVHESSTVIGTIDAAGAAATGLREGTPVVAGAGDQAAAGVGSGAIEPGLVSISLGTSGVVFAAVDEIPRDASGALGSFCHAVDGRCHVMGCMLSAGGSLQWWRDATGIHAGDDAYDRWIEEAAEIPPGSEGLLFLPYLSGERTPHPDPKARGAFIGLTTRHDRRHMARAVLEGITFGLADAVDLVRKAGHTVDLVRVSGGGARSETWRQLMADVFNADVELVTVPGATAFGAALLASVGAGLYPDVASAAKAMVTTSSRTSPGKQASAYPAWHERFKELYPALAPSMASITDLESSN